MTDRDTFAAAALTGLLATADYQDLEPVQWAQAAYDQADVMLVLRQRLRQQRRAPGKDRFEEGV